MGMAGRIVALHGALWTSDRWYRWSWYIWPISLALLIAGWICIGKPAGATASGGSWAKPITQKPVTQNSKAVNSPLPNLVDLEVTSCFAARTPSSEIACTRAIDGGKLTGQRLAAVYTQRGYLACEKQPDNALRDYNAALEIHPGFVAALSNRA